MAVDKNEARRILHQVRSELASLQLLKLFHFGEECHALLNGLQQEVSEAAKDIDYDDEGSPGHRPMLIEKASNLLGITKQCQYAFKKCAKKISVGSKNTAKTELDDIMLKLCRITLDVNSASKLVRAKERKPGISVSHEKVRAVNIASLPSKGIWVGLSSSRLELCELGVDLVQDIPCSETVAVIAVSKNSDVWTGHMNGSVAMHKPGQTFWNGKPQRLLNQAITAIAFDEDEAGTTCTAWISDEAGDVRLVKADLDSGELWVVSYINYREWLDPSPSHLPISQGRVNTMLVHKNRAIIAIGGTHPFLLLWKTSQQNQPCRHLESVELHAGQAVTCMTRVPDTGVHSLSTMDRFHVVTAQQLQLSVWVMDNVSLQKIALIKSASDKEPFKHICGIHIFPHHGMMVTVHVDSTLRIWPSPAIKRELQLCSGRDNDTPPPTWSHRVCRLEVSAGSFVASAADAERLVVASGGGRVLSWDADWLRKRADLAGVVFHTLTNRDSRDSRDGWERGESSNSHRTSFGDRGERERGPSMSIPGRRVRRASMMSSTSEVMYGGDTEQSESLSDDSSDKDAVVEPPPAPSMAMSMGVPHIDVIDATKIQKIQQIGEGSYGVVHLGLYMSLQVAIKELKLDVDPEKEQRLIADLEAEVSMLSTLVHHPYFVRLFGMCKEPPMIVTEYYDKGSLFHHLRLIKENDPSAHDSPLKTWQGRLQVAMNIAVGMVYMHNKGMVHGDLRSPNVFLAGDWTAKIGDLGLAKVLNENNTAPASTTCPRSMAPEIYHRNTMNEMTDVYAFGIILWELLTFKVPYEGEATVPVMLQKMNLSPNKAHHPSIPEDHELLHRPQHSLEAFKVLLTSCWAPQPDDRPTFQSIIKFLRKMLLAESWRSNVNDFLKRDKKRKNAQGFVSALQQETDKTKKGEANIPHAITAPAAPLATASTSTSLLNNPSASLPDSHPSETSTSQDSTTPTPLMADQMPACQVCRQHPTHCQCIAQGPLPHAFTDANLPPSHHINMNFLNPQAPNGRAFTPDLTTPSTFTQDLAPSPLIHGNLSNPSNGSSSQGGFTSNATSPPHSGVSNLVNTSGTSNTLNSEMFNSSNFTLTNGSPSNTPPNPSFLVGSIDMGARGPNPNFPHPRPPGSPGPREFTLDHSPEVMGQGTLPSAHPQRFDPPSLIPTTTTTTSDTAPVPDNNHHPAARQFVSPFDPSPSSSASSLPPAGQPAPQFPSPFDPPSSSSSSSLPLHAPPPTQPAPQFPSPFDPPSSTTPQPPAPAPIPAPTPAPAPRAIQFPSPFDPAPTPNPPTPVNLAELNLSNLSLSDLSNSGEGSSSLAFGSTASVDQRPSGASSTSFCVYLGHNTGNSQASLASTTGESIRGESVREQPVGDGPQQQQQQQQQGVRAAQFASPFAPAGAATAAAGTAGTVGAAVGAGPATAAPQPQQSAGVVPVQFQSPFAAPQNPPTPVSHAPPAPTPAPLQQQQQPPQALGPVPSQFVSPFARNDAASQPPPSTQLPVIISHQQQPPPHQVPTPPSTPPAAAVPPHTSFTHPHTSQPQPANITYLATSQPSPYPPTTPTTPQLPPASLPHPPSSVPISQPAYAYTQHYPSAQAVTLPNPSAPPLHILQQVPQTSGPYYHQVPVTLTQSSPSLSTFTHSYQTISHNGTVVLVQTTAAPQHMVPPPVTLGFNPSHPTHSAYASTAVTHTNSAPAQAMMASQNTPWPFAAPQLSRSTLPNEAPHPHSPAPPPGRALQDALGLNPSVHHPNPSYGSVPPTHTPTYSSPHLSSPMSSRSSLASGSSTDDPFGNPTKRHNSKNLLQAAVDSAGPMVSNGRLGGTMSTGGHHSVVSFATSLKGNNPSW